MREVAFDATNDIADDFAEGFFDTGMVLGVTEHIEKRIESMIKESIDALNNHCEYLDYGNDHDTGYKQGFENAIDFLTEHFGLR